MKMVKVGDNEGIKIMTGVFLTFLVLFVIIGLPLIMVAKSANEDDVDIDQYRIVSAMYEELPELRDQIRQSKEDGVLTRVEVRALTERADQIRKDREMEKIK